jgi:mRNA interferase MazF
MEMVKRSEIWLVGIAESDTNTRPCVIVSPNETNSNLEYVTIAPITSDVRNYPTRVSFELFGSEKFIALDQLQTAEKNRLTKLVGKLEDETKNELLDILQEFFAK